jgi:4-hydroxy-tetrahydrodipicolinate synthase
MSTVQSSRVATLSGYVSALPTPFVGHGLDEAAFAEFCEWQIGQGISGLVVNGTTGVAPTLRTDEQFRLLRIAVEAAGGRVPVIAGAGSNATSHAVELAQLAETAGADGLLVVTPYYNRPGQEGLFQHFRAVHEATELPILLYDVPTRTACTLGLETIERLAHLPRIVGLKDATGDLRRPTQLRRRLGARFRLMSGDDATAFNYIALGGDGCISVVSNVVPKLCALLHVGWRRGDHFEVQHLVRQLEPLTKALFAESNPVPVKYALSLMGHMRDDVRLPLCSASLPTRSHVARAMSALGLSSVTGPAEHMPRPVSLPAQVTAR